MNGVFSAKRQNLLCLGETWDLQSMRISLCSYWLYTWTKSMFFSLGSTSAWALLMLIEDYLQQGKSSPEEFFSIYVLTHHFLDILSLSSLQLTTVPEDGFLRSVELIRTRITEHGQKRPAKPSSSWLWVVWTTQPQGKCFPSTIACQENLLGRGERIKIVVKNSAVMARESKVDGSTAAVGVLSASACSQG